MNKKMIRVSLYSLHLHDSCYHWHSDQSESDQQFCKLVDPQRSNQNRYWDKVNRHRTIQCKKFPRLTGNLQMKRSFETNYYFNVSFNQTRSLGKVTTTRGIDDNFDLLVTEYRYCISIGLLSPTLANKIYQNFPGLSLYKNKMLFITI